MGNFSPTLLRTEDVEVAVKKYKAGDRETWHYHKVATEITCIISGEVRMAGKNLRAGDVIILEPGEGSEFEAITDAVNVVVKHPGALNDKYLQGE